MLPPTVTDLPSSGQPTRYEKFVDDAARSISAKRAMRCFTWTKYPQIIDRPGVTPHLREFTARAAKPVRARAWRPCDPMQCLLLLLVRERQPSMKAEAACNAMLNS